MAKEKTKSIWVVALTMVQKPNRVWAKPGDVFRVPEDKLSKRSMRAATDEEIAKAEAAGGDAPDPVDEKNAEIDRLKEELAEAQAGRAVMLEAANLLQVEQGELIEKIKSLTGKPAASVAGQKKADTTAAKS